MRKLYMLMAEKTVTGKLCKWYPLDHQRKHKQVKELREHMRECSICADPVDSLCRQASDLLVKADIALGLRKA